MSKYGWIFQGRNEFGVMHRDRGNIPDCTPAPRSGIYRPEDIDLVRPRLLERAARFAHVLDDEQTGDRCGIFVEPIFGAYGEAL